MVAAMPRVLGIDSSLTNSGMCRIAIPEDWGGTPVGSWSADTWCIPSKPGLDKSPAAYSDRISGIIAAMEPHIGAADLVVLEGQSSALKGSSAQTLPWLWGRIVDCTVAHAVELVVVPPAMRIKYATGKGNSQKDLVLAAAIRRFPNLDITGNDVADAVLLAAIGCRYLELPIDDMPKTHWEKVMNKVNAA
jgi:crossover junction endodeoxyribonuclease RuvC